MAFVRLSAMPSPPTLRCANVQAPIGGLNIKDISWLVAANQSPEMKNMWWEDGALRSRPEQMVYNNGMIKEIGDVTAVSGWVAAHPKLYRGWYVVAYADSFYAVSEDFNVHAQVEVIGADIPALTDTRGAFFVHNGVLYYKAKGVFKRFEETEVVVEGSDLHRLCAKDVEPFVPTILINGDPTVGGAGDLYQPVNRFTRKRVAHYTGDADTKEIRLPEPAKTWSVEYLDGTGAKKSVSATGVSEDGAVVALSVSTGFPDIVPDMQNNIFVQYEVADDTGFYDTLMDCYIAEVYGAGKAQCLVLAGCAAQPNAYFWSGNTDVGMDVGYFPVENYNLAGGAGNPITAFGKQQNMLVVFQERSVGRCTFDTEEIDGRTFITLHHEVINPNIGCDIPHSVQLIENNLVFVHSRRGVLLIKDTSSAHENNIVKMSVNIEAPAETRGLLHDLRQDRENTCSLDDGAHYWLCVNGHAWVWDYSLGASISDPGKNSWFYFDGIAPGAWFGYEQSEPSYLGRDGYLRRFVSQAEDAEHPTGQWKTKGEIFECLVTLHTLDFNTYEVLKNVEKAIFVVQGSGNATIQIEYETDYGVRVDPTPLVTRVWKFVPRDLSFRALRISPFAFTAVRKPGCRHVRHFLTRLRNQERGAKISFVSAQVYYTFQGVDR